MSIERECGLVAFLCDSEGCFNFLRTEERDFETALEEFEDNNWTSRKVNNTWMHVCPECLEDESHGLAL